MNINTTDFSEDFVKSFKNATDFVKHPSVQEHIKMGLYDEDAAKAAFTDFATKKVVKEEN